MARDTHLGQQAQKIVTHRLKARRESRHDHDCSCNAGIPAVLIATFLLFEDPRQNSLKMPYNGIGLDTARGRSASLHLSTFQADRCVVGRTGISPATPPSSTSARVLPADHSVVQASDTGTLSMISRVRLFIGSRMRGYWTMNGRDGSRSG